MWPSLFIFIGIIIKKQLCYYLLTETKEESKGLSDSWIISISAGVCAPLFAILVIGVCCLAKYGKLKNVQCCSVSQDQGGATNDARQEESHEMIPLSIQWQCFIIKDICDIAKHNATTI